MQGGKEPQISPFQGRGQERGGGRKGEGQHRGMEGVQRFIKMLLPIVMFLKSLALSLFAECQQDI